MYKALYLSPMIPSYNIAETALFFKNVFEFNTALDSKDYMILYKDNLTIHILHAGKRIGQMEFYIEVDNIDPLWDLIRHKIAEMKIPIREPFDRDYGMREFHIGIPHTKALMFVGHAIK